MLLKMVLFHSFLWLSNSTLYVYTTSALFSMVTCRSICVAANGIISFFFMAE